MFKQFFGLIKTFITASSSAVNTNAILPLILLRGSIVVITEVIILSSKKISESVKGIIAICEILLGLTWACH